jgi:hypothetical protein
VPCGAECDQVLVGVMAGMAAELSVVHVKIRHRASTGHIMC